jgi:hypothetical protein
MNSVGCLPTQDELVALNEVEVQWHWFISEAPHVFHGEEVANVIVEYLSGM